MSAPLQSPESESELPTEWEVKNISAHMLWLTKESGGDSSKRRNGKAKEKTKKIEKNKEFSFTFEDSPNNYLDFLSALLKKHGHEKYAPVTNRHRFGIQVLVPPKKAYVAVIFQSVLLLMTLSVGERMPSTLNHQRIFKTLSGKS